MDARSVPAPFCSCCSEYLLDGEDELKQHRVINRYLWKCRSCGELWHDQNSANACCVLVEEPEEEVLVDDDPFADHDWETCDCAVCSEERRLAIIFWVKREAQIRRRKALARKQAAS